MKKKLAFLLCMILTLCSMSGAALAAESEQDADPASALIPAADIPPSVSAYPAEVRTSEENGVYRLEKVYYLTAKDDPSTIPTADFEREGRTYTLIDLLKNDQTETDTREHIEVVTLDSKTKDMAEILKMLENNSRIDLHDLAIMLGTDESMVLEEIEKMENEGIICGYPTLINWDKTDTEKVTAFIEVRVTPQRGQGFEKLAERITNYPEVKSIYLMSGAFDFAIFLEGKTLKEVSMFVSTKLSTLEAVAGTATHFVLKKYKDHGMILIDKEPTNRMKVTP